MPVPVPARYAADSICTKAFSAFSDECSPGLAKHSAFKHLLNSLPDPPSGPPPAFTDRETWIRSLPPNRRFKVRPEISSPDSFPVLVIEPHKEAAQAWPPSAVPSSNVKVVTSNIGTTGSGLPLPRVAHAPLFNGKPWPPSPPKSIQQAMKADERRKAVLLDDTFPITSVRQADDDLSEEWTEDEAFFVGPTFHRQATLRKNAMSDDKETAGGVVTNVVRTALEFPSDADVPMVLLDGTTGQSTARVTDRNSVTDEAVNDTAPVQTSSKQQDRPVPVPARKALTPIPTTVTTSDMSAYKKKIAEPMSEWIAQYIWKVVTHGMSLSKEFLADDESGYGRPNRAYSAQPPLYLADSIRTLLCSTLLQPSAIFLALWYIARMPVFFGIFAYSAKEKSKEYKFRLELLGEGSTDPGAERTRQLLEAHAPFRLLLLGVMLANKWLDDNTFSNKTWHQVSGIPMRALNRLESLGLDILSHDLSMLPSTWEQWLEHVQNYHRSLAPYPEPIGPPKDTPHIIIRRTIEELIAAGSPPITTGVLPEPVFLGLEERRKEREREFLAREELDLRSLGLDDDGPPKEEYVPKRHKDLKGSRDRIENPLPPPAEWSPAADPPIHRARPVYQAVQRPPPAPIPAHARANVHEVATYTTQANGYFSAAFSDVTPPGEIHVHGRANGQGWRTPQELMCNTSGKHFSVSQPCPPNYFPVHNGLYPGTLLVDHTASSHYASLQCSTANMYHPGAMFDAPPPSDLFRPTWLRT